MNTVNKKMDESDRQRVQRIRNGDETAFEQFFFEYYRQLCAFALKMTGSRELARDVVQEVFLRIWKGRVDWEIKESLKVYMYQAVRNQALNSVQKQKRRLETRNEFAEEIRYSGGATPGESLHDNNKLVRQIWELVREMPERRQFVFTLHRKHGLSYKEISEVMNISRKTVENHMGLALNELRERLNTGRFD